MASMRQLLPLAALILVAKPVLAKPSTEIIHNIVLSHGILASLAWVIFFPLGAIWVRIFKHNARNIHWMWQASSFIIFAVAWALGVYLATILGKWVTWNGHAIIGTVIFGLALMMPVLGIAHHFAWKDGKRIYKYAWMHVWLGRVLITAGMINGGLGLQLTNTIAKGEIVYGVVAGSMWLLWVSISVIAIIRSHGDVAVRGESGEKVQGLKHLRRDSQDTVVEEPKGGHATTGMLKNEKKGGDEEQLAGGVVGNDQGDIGNRDVPPFANRETAVHVHPGGRDTLHGGTHYNTRMANIIDPAVDTSNAV